MIGACIDCGEGFEAATGEQLHKLIEAHRNENHKPGPKAKPKENAMPESTEKNPPEKKPAPVTQIFVLAERIPANPREGEKQIENCHHRLGYWTKEHLAEAAAKRHNLVVVELKEGEDV